MTRCLRYLVLFALLAASTLDAAASRARADEPVTVRVGFAGKFKVGVWTPVEVILDQATKSGKITITVPDGDGVPSRVTAAVRQGRAAVLVRFGRMASPMEVEYPVGPESTAKKRFIPTATTDGFPVAIAADTRLLVTIGADASGVDKAIEALDGLNLQRRFAVAKLASTETLPNRWYGYEGVDAIVLATGRPKSTSISEAQVDALDQWVRLGGRLVFAVGSRGEEVLANDSPLARFAPGRFQKMVPLRQTEALESLVGSSKAIASTSGGRPVMRVPQLRTVVGRVEAHEADLPLIVRTARGFGEVIFLAGDLDQGPLAAWGDRPKLVSRLLNLPEARVESSPDTRTIMHFGFADMAGQLRSALDRFPGVRLIPFSWVVGLVMLYLLIIGPVDYFFLRKVTRRMQWTWITFPAAVLAFSMLAYFLAEGYKGREVRIHQADLIDVDSSSGLVRGTSWTNIFSPRVESYNLSFSPQLSGRPNTPQVLLGWFGLPGAGLGGMDPHTSTPASVQQAYTFTEDLSAIHGLPIPIWSTRSLVARWHAPKGYQLDAKLVQQGTSPQGTITNTLEVTLNNCVLAYRRWSYDLGTLESGQTVRISPLGKRNELKTLLTGRKFVLEKKGQSYRQEATPYNQTSTDPAYILRMMMFFNEAGGERYTGLTNGYQSFVDLSDLLKLDRAIFVADSDDTMPATQWRRDDLPISTERDTHTTIYRFVLPIEKEPSNL